MAEKDIASAVGISPDELEVPIHRPEGVDTYSRKNAVSTMLSEERAKKANHAWDESQRAALVSGNNIRIPTDKRDRTSGFDRRLPFKGPFGNYWVQNRKIYLGRKKVVSLSEVPEEWTSPTKRYPKGEVLLGETVKLREQIALALAISDQEILKGDPLRCKVCIEFRGRSDIDLMAHFRSAHPRELDQLVEGMNRMREEELAEEEAEAALSPARPTERPKQRFRAAAP